MICVMAAECQSQRAINSPSNFKKASAALIAMIKKLLNKKDVMQTDKNR